MRAAGRSHLMMPGHMLMALSYLAQSEDGCAELRAIVRELERYRISKSTVYRSLADYSRRPSPYLARDGNCYRLTAAGEQAVASIRLSFSPPVSSVHKRLAQATRESGSDESPLL